MTAAMRRLLPSIMATTSIVIAERGTDWVNWARRLRGTANDTVVLMQDAQEAPEAFARRVLSRVERLVESGTALFEAAFVSGETTNPAQRRERSLIVRNLSSLLSKAGGARLYLDPTSKPSQAGYRMMRALAWTLSDLAGGPGRGVAISVVSAPGVC